MSGLSTSPFRSAAFMLPMPRPPIPSATNSTRRPSSYGGLEPDATCQPDLRAAAQPGDRSWHEMGTLRPPSARHGAAFQTNVENARELTPAGLPDPQTGGIYPTNTIVAGAAYRVQGFDFEVAGKITDKWSSDGRPRAHEIGDHEFDCSASISAFSSRISHINRSTCSPNINSRIGWSSAVRPSTSRRSYGGSLLAANGGVAYNQAPDPTVLPSHWRFDAFVEAKIGPYTSLKLYVQNIFNRTYYDSHLSEWRAVHSCCTGRTCLLDRDVKF